MYSVLHCFFRTASDLQVRLGGDQKYNGNQVNVATVFIHEDYQRRSGYLFNDIALLHLAEPVNYTALIKPICLPEPFMEPPVPSLCYISGWGDTRGTGNVCWRR